MLLAVSDSQVSPGALGFIVVAALGVAVFFLIRSMTKHLKKVETARIEAAEREGDDAHSPWPGSRGHVNH